MPVRTGAAPESVHRVTIEERGSFCFATCSCGWFAPGRRSRDRSRRDASEHLAQEGQDVPEG
ncbi:hypothetical protein [Kitasatospora sp. MAP5-34]|uniref:hypothetical protein n=1 Tax=Kitasatospora sp. MAP5-34 TaxID=3035102 RepID=UPI0024736126|nr:hypothetical protein [Kitasatospora sp. MAP5-34]